MRRNENELSAKEATDTLSILYFFFFLGRCLWRMETPRLGVESELQLQAYTTVTAKGDLSRVCGLHHSSWQHRILNPLSETRDGTCAFMDTSQIHFHCTTMGTPEESAGLNLPIYLSPPSPLVTVSLFSMSASVDRFICAIF